jgi:hypothetical protein
MGGLRPSRYSQTIFAMEHAQIGAGTLLGGVVHTYKKKKNGPKVLIFIRNVSTWNIETGLLDRRGTSRNSRV